MHPFDFNDSTYSHCADLLATTCSVQNGCPVNGRTRRLSTRQGIVSTPAVRYGGKQNIPKAPIPVKYARAIKEATPKRCVNAYNRDYQMIGSSFGETAAGSCSAHGSKLVRSFELARELNF
jgi:hypothetical protein